MRKIMIILLIVSMLMLASCVGEAGKRSQYGIKKPYIDPTTIPQQPYKTEYYPGGFWQPTPVQPTDPNKPQPMPAPVPVPKPVPSEDTSSYGTQK
jgi:hypothetical protein